MKEFTKISLHNHVGGISADKKIDHDYTAKPQINYTEAINTIESLYEKGYRLIAITNANNINVELVYLIQYYFTKKGYDLTVLPGTELNLYSDDESKFLHVCLILDNNNACIYEVQNLLEKQIEANGKNGISYDQLLDLLVSEDYKIKSILSPHGIKQDDRSLANNTERIKEFKAMDSALFPILIEDNKKYNRISLLEKIKEKLNDDEYDWVSVSPDISAVDRGYYFDPTFVWCNNNFNDLFYASIMKNTRFFRESDLPQKPTYIEKIDISFDGKKSSSINLSQGLNTIVGDSGSGKTLLLNWIYKSLSGENIEDSTSSVENEYENIYKTGSLTLLDNKGEEMTLDDIDVFHGANLYNKIIKLISREKGDIVKLLGGEINSSPFIKEVEKLNEYVKTNINIKISKLDEWNNFQNKFNSLVDCEQLIDEYQSKITSDTMTSFNVTEIEEKIKSQANKKVEIESLNKEVQDLVSRLKEIIISRSIPLEHMLEFFSKTVRKKLLKDYFYLEANQTENSLMLEKINLLNVSISNYNNLIGKRSTQYDKLINQIESDKVLASKSLLDYYYMEKREKSIVDAFPVIELKSLEINNDKSLKLSYTSQKNIFEIDELDKAISVGFAKRINPSKALLTPKLISPVLTSIDILNVEHIDKLCSEIVNKYYKKIDSNYIQLEFTKDYKKYLEIMVQVQDLESQEYVDINLLSAGQLGKYYIEKLLDEEIKTKATNQKLILFFDQPDNSIGKKFILESLVTKLTKLKLDYQIFITTHEPLLVLNADANTIIHATNEKTISEGNNFEYKNVDITSNVSSTNDVINIISELIDGSHDAVTHRHNIYEGMKYGN